jgi:hypothetical protein
VGEEAVLTALAREQASLIFRYARAEDLRWSSEYLRVSKSGLYYSNNGRLPSNR